MWRFLPTDANKEKPVYYKQRFSESIHNHILHRRNSTRMTIKNNLYQKTTCCKHTGYVCARVARSRFRLALYTVNLWVITTTMMTRMVRWWWQVTQTAAADGRCRLIVLNWHSFSHSHVSSVVTLATSMDHCYPPHDSLYCLQVWLRRLICLLTYSTERYFTSFLFCSILISTASCKRHRKALTFLIACNQPRLINCNAPLLADLAEHIV